MKKKFPVIIAANLIAIGLGAPLYANSVLSTPPKVTLSGEGNAAFYAFKGAQRQENGGRGNGTAVFVEDTRLNIEAEGMTHEYGGIIFNYLMGITGTTASNTTSVEESRIMLKGQWGRILIGTHRPVGDRMAKGTHNTQVATGGPMGNYSKVINISTGVNKSVDMIGTAKDVNKISIISPRVKGFQLGVSFTPHGAHQGDAKPKTIAASNLPFTKNNWEASLNYITRCSNELVWKFSLSGVFAKAHVGGGEKALAYPRHDAKSYAIGTEIEYKNFTWGAEFINNGRSMARKDIVGQNMGQVYSTGLSYNFGKNTVSAGYLHSTRSLGQITYQGNTINPSAKANVFSVGVERKVAPGLKIYAEGTRFIYQTHQAWVDVQNSKKQFNDDDGVRNNQGHVLIMGTKVTF